MKKITEFKQGDIITRVVPALDGEIKVRNFMGERMQYVGVANGNIYVKIDESKLGIEIPEELKKHNPNLIAGMPFDLFEDGWDIYVEPSSLFETTLLDKKTGDIKFGVDTDSVEMLERKLQSAIDQEDWDVAAKYRDLLKEKQQA